MEWQTEPNNMSFTHCNLQCEIKRNPFGSLNIYVLIPETNIYFGIEEDQLNTLLKPEREITYANQWGTYWKIGCDFGHVQDFSPDVKEYDQPEFMKKLEEFFGFKAATAQDYKNIEYAIEKVKKLAESLVLVNRTI